MPTGLTTDKGMIGSGDLLIKRLDITGDQWRPIGNASVFTLQPLVENIERKSFQRGKRGQTLETLNRLNGVDVKITVDTFGRENLALALAGSSAGITQSETTAAVANITAKLDQWVEVGAYNLSSVSVAVSSTDMTEGTDYLLKPETGMIMALSSGAINDGDTMDVTHNAPAIAATDAYEISGAVNADVLLSLKMDGYNESSGNTEITEVYQVRITPQSAVAFITNEFNSLELSGKAETPPEKDHPFKTTVIPSIN